MSILDAPNITAAQAAAYVIAANTAANNALSYAQTATQQAAIVAATNRVYATTAAGIAGTTTGQYFYVPAGVSGQSVILYLNNAGTALSVTTMPDYTGVSSTVLSTTTSLPAIRPSFLLDFVRAESLSGSITSRTAPATTLNSAQNLVPVAGSKVSAGRLDHDPLTGAPLGLLLEDAFSNLIAYTEDITQTYWNKVGSTTGATVNPLGPGFNMMKLVGDTSTGTHGVTIGQFSGPVISNGNKYVVSVFGMAGEYTKLSLVIGPSGCFPTAVSATLDLSAGTMTALSGMTTPVVTKYKNGVFRFMAQTVAATNSANFVMSVNLMNSAGTSSFTGDGASGAYIGGMNTLLQTTTFNGIPVSYAPATATRPLNDSDVASVILDTWLNSTEGTFIMEHDCASGVPILETNSTTILTSVGAGRVALAYSASGTSVVQAGGTPTTTATPITFGSTLTLIPTGRYSAHCKRLIYYPKALTTAQLQLLTSV